MHGPKRQANNIMKTKLLQGFLLLVGLSITSVSWAASVLIINGTSTTSEPGTTASITTNLTSLLVAAGHTVTVSDPVPGSLAGFAQVWDIRFANAAPLTAGNITLYVSYMAGGGKMFVMGENSFFGTRNTSVLALITSAGGGTLTFTTPASTETVNPPFNSPNAVSTVTYCAPGGTTGFGTGQFITSSGGSGAGVGFAVGTLVNALAGSLAVIFDVNFMQNTCNPPNDQNLVRNLIGFVATGGLTGGGGGCGHHTVHGHISTVPATHSGTSAQHHGTHGHTVAAGADCPPHAPGHSPGLTPDAGEGFFRMTAVSADPVFSAALNEDDSLNGDASASGNGAAILPARRGKVIQLFGAADGLFLDERDDQPASGFTPPASGSPLYYTTGLPEVRIGGVAARVLFSGLAPGLTGVWQINVEVPEGAPSGRIPVEITYAGENVTSVDVEVK